MGIFTYTDPHTQQGYNFKILGDTPTEEEFARMRPYLDAGRAQYQQDYLSVMGMEAPQYDDGTAIGRGWASGVEDARGGIGELLQTLGQRTGWEGLANYGSEMEQNAARNVGIAGLSGPAPMSWRDVQGLGSGLTYMGELAGASLPVMGAGAAGALAGTAAAASAPISIPTALAAGAGAALMTAPYYTGSILQGQERISGEDNVNLGTAALGGTVAAALDAASLGVLGKLGVGKAAIQSLSGEVGRGLTARILSGTAAGGLTEGTTEALQEATQMLAEGADPNSKEVQDRLIDAFIGGGVLGGAIGGAGRGAFGKRPGEVTPPPADTTDTEIPDTTPGTTPPPVIPDTFEGLSPEEQAAVDAADAAASNAERTKTVLDYLGVGPKAGMRTRLAASEAAPDDASVIDELIKYRKVHASNAQLMEQFPDTPARIDDYIAKVTAAPKPAPAPVAAKPAPVTEITPAGEQMVIPGVAPLTQGQQALERARQADAQRIAVAKPADEGLFATSPVTGDLVEMAKAPRPGSYEAAVAAGMPPAPGAPVTPSKSGIQVNGVDDAITNGVGNITVEEDGAPVPFKNFALSVDGNTAEVGMVERDKAARKGVGYDAYVALGGALAARGITLRSSELLQAPGKALWTRLESQGLAKYDPKTKRYSFSGAATTTDVKPKARGPERLQKYPLATAIGGIKRGSRLAKEIEGALGVAPGKLPTSMYASSGFGVAEVDDPRVSPGEMTDWAYAIPADDTGNAFDQTAFVDALIAEANGNPLRVGRQADLAAKQREVADAGRAPSSAATAPTGPMQKYSYIQPRDVDISTESERYDLVDSTLNGYLRDTGRALSNEEYTAARDQLLDAGGDVEEVVAALPSKESVTPSDTADQTLSDKIGNALADEVPAKPKGRRAANKRDGAKVSRRYAWRPAKAAVEVDTALEDAKRKWDDAITARWESRVANLSPGAQEEVRALVLDPSDAADIDPSTVGDRKAVLDIVEVEEVSLANRKLAGMENAAAAKKYFDKFPTVVEALQLLARDVGSDPKVSKLIDNTKKAKEIGDLPDWGEATSFLDNGVGPKVALKALDWVQQNLSPAANKYLQEEVARMKRLEKAARRRVTKYAPTTEQRIAAEEKARAAVDEAVQKGKEVQALKKEQNLSGALAGVANTEAVAEAWASNLVAKERREPGLAPAPKGMTATDEDLSEARRAAVPRRKGEPGDMYAIRVLRPDLTADQISKLTDEEMLGILADAKASMDFLGGSLFSKVQAVRQTYEMHQPLDQIAINALRNGHLAIALRYIATRVADPQVAALLNTVAQNIRGTKVAIIDPLHRDLIGSEAKALYDSYGLYYPAHDTIVLNENIGLTVSALLHEALHAVTLAEIRKPNSQLRAELQKLFDSVVDDILPYMPGKLTVEEFVAEAKTNPALRARLAQLTAQGVSLPSQARGKSVLGWLKTLLTKFVQALGRNTRRPSALMLADNLINMAISPERNNGADLLYSKRAGAGVSSVQDSIRDVTAATASSAQNTGTKLADAASSLLDVQGNILAKIGLGLLPTQFVGDLAAKEGIKSPHAMLTLIQHMNSAYDRAVERVNYMRQAYARVVSADRKLLDALMPGSSVESVDLTLSRDNYDHFWLAYETLDANGDITNRVRRKFKSALDRDKAVANLNLKTPATRTAARATQDVDPEQLKAYDSMKRVFDTQLSPQGRAMYASMRDFYQKEYDALWETLKGNINDSLPSDPAIAAELKKSAYLMIFGKGEITPYFPLVREGDWWLEFAVYNPITQSTEPVKQTFSSPRERDRFLAALRDDPRVAKDPTTGEPQAVAYTATDLHSGTFADRSMFVADTLSLLARYNAKHAGTGNAIKSETIQEIAQALVEAAPEGSLAKQFHRRKNVAGYTESTDLALEQKGYRLASAAARFKYGRDIRALQKSYTDQSAGNPNAKQQLILRELAALGDTALRPQNSLAERAARLANKVTYIYTLLGSPASALVNLSGMANIIFPQLGGTYGFGAATKALARASKDFMGSGYHRTGELPVAIDGETTETLRSMPSMDNYFVLDTNGKYTVNTALNFTPEQQTRAQELLPLMQELGDRGMSHKSQFYDSAGLEEMGRARGLAERAMAFFGVPFHMVERMNRQVTAIAAYELELARMESKPSPSEALLSKAEKKAKAAHAAVYQAQLLNGSASMNTAPRLTQRGLGRVMFMYKNYGITVSTVLYKSAMQLARNLHGGNKELRTQAMKQLVGHTGVTFLMAGASGLPLYGLYAMIGNALRDDDDLSVEEATRLWMGEMAYKGVINNVTGFEVADRVGLSGLLYRANKFNSDPSAEETLVQMVLGAPWSTASGIGRGVKDIAAGEYQRGLESMSPAVIKNALQAFRFATEGGVQTRQGNFMYEDPSSLELFGKLIGFNMAEYVRRQAQASESVRVGNEVSDRKTKLLQRLFIAYRTGDTAGVADAMADIEEFNNTTGVMYPKAVIRASTINSSFDRREESVKRMVNGVSVNPEVRDVLVEQYGALIDGLTQ